MDRNAPEYVAFLLRLWKEKLDGTYCWRAVLQHAQTHEEQYFVDLETLLDFLRTQFSERKEDAIGRSKEPDDT